MAACGLPATAWKKSQVFLLDDLTQADFSAMIISQQEIPMKDLIDGTITGWPVSLMIERDVGGKSYGAHCAVYTNENDDSAPVAVEMQCNNITDACDGLKPSAALRKAKSMGFIPDAG
jgi:hypothetical protein